MQKVGDGEQRQGSARSLKIIGNEAGTSGISQVVSGLSGGEELTLTAWIKINGSSYSLSFGAVRSKVEALDVNEVLVPAGLRLGNCNHFRKHSWTFTNPVGNTQVRIWFYVSDTAGDGESMIGWIDDVSLVPAGTTGLASPAEFSATGATSEPVTLSWEPAQDVSIEYVEIFKRLQEETDWTFLPMARLGRHQIDFFNGIFVDDEGTLDHEYRAVFVEYTGEKSPESTAVPTEPSGNPADINNDGVVDVTDFLMLLANWGETGDNPADINGDGVVDVTDFLALQENWGWTG